MSTSPALRSQEMRTISQMQENYSIMKALELLSLSLERQQAEIAVMQKRLLVGSSPLSPGRHENSEPARISLNPKPNDNGTIPPRGSMLALFSPPVARWNTRIHYMHFYGTEDILPTIGIYDYPASEPKRPTL